MHSQRGKKVKATHRAQENKAQFKINEAVTQRAPLFSVDVTNLPLNKCHAATPLAVDDAPSSQNVPHRFLEKPMNAVKKKSFCETFRWNIPKTRVFTSLDGSSRDKLRLASSASGLGPFNYCRKIYFGAKEQTKQRGFP